MPLIEGGPFAGVSTDTLTITDATGRDAGVYDVRVSGGCNLGTSVLSQPAVLTIGGADLNFDGVVDLIDYLLFQQSFTGP